MDLYQALGLFGLVLLIVLVLILREFWAWYWKTNKIIQQQTAIIERLDTIIGQQKEQIAQNKPLE